MKKFIIAAVCSITTLSSISQTFIDKAVVEYEVRTNVKKTMGNSSWAEMMKNTMPDFKTAYYHLTFDNNTSIYKFHHWQPDVKLPEFLKRGEDENIWYFDHNKGMFSMQKNVVGSNFNIQDSIPSIQWKLTNENRLIAGFNCRKAVGIIMDSIYVFAFYSEEIMYPGGPASINGLPGLVLGLTIPRLYTSWIATKVMVNDVPVSAIKPLSAKKPLTRDGLKSTIRERISEWGNADDPDSKFWMDQFVWSAML